MEFESDTTQGRNAIRPMIYTGFTKAVSTANNRIGENNLIQSTVAKRPLIYWEMDMNAIIRNMVMFNSSAVESLYRR